MELPKLFTSILHHFKFGSDQKNQLICHLRLVYFTRLQYGQLCSVQVHVLYIYIIKCLGLRMCYVIRLQWPNQINFEETGGRGLMQLCMESDETERFQSDTYLADFDDRHVSIVENNGIVLYWYRSLRLRRVLLALSLRLRLGHNKQRLLGQPPIPSSRITKSLN